MKEFNWGEPEKEDSRAYFHVYGYIETDEDMIEQIKFEEFLENFVGPPTLQEFEELQQAAIEEIDRKMLANAR